MDGLTTILIIAYSAWAIYSGYKVVSGRSEWLDRKSPVNMIVKALLCVVVGYVIGGFYLIFLVLKFIFGIGKNL